ncbi:prepilin-type N-terminal cleavage/methylation domain-containing protein [Agarivorans sp. TSD2052]|uniref:PilW family protein n=1 Tax=Agarivorans sp. TSD2052 TaxID=2937286 RepID=UPI00200ECADB|nr:prepilin-type N-terminal cleavage/methylation domain-containing protein [Agarivorans sp. TSD2052]UPW17996.1 prepilin-type N-terminal cleavage/methylation domain-containing protein [Agarivorans sp. TSD2052]
MTKSQGFTLIELVITMVLLAILAIATSDFIRSGALIYRQSADRQVLVSEARFAIQRLSRELHNSLPNSARLDANNAGDPCLSFVPTVASNTYINVPLIPNAAASASMVTAPNQPTISAQGSHWLSVYVLGSDEVLNSDGRLQDAFCTSSRGKALCINSISNDASSGLSTVNFAGPIEFISDSPAQRAYIITEPVRYCVEGAKLVRYQPADADDGIMMASKLEPNSGTQPFQVVQPSLTRNGLVNLRLRFVEKDEFVEFNHDIVILNQP